MSRKVQNLLWLPAMALSGSAQALGLGDLHVTSALNEPLSAQIDIVGATPEELMDVRAAIANRDVFQRYGADRPAFLGTANFRVGKDKAGRPVLLVHSSDAFTEPLVSLLVDLRWSTGELVREYTLLLDPAISASSASRVPDPAPDVPRAEPVRAETAPVGAPPVTDRVAAAPPPLPHPNSPLPTGQLYVVARRDTLSAIARRNGARTEAELQKTMVAIFRANPNAFMGNINRLRVGETLTIPSNAIIAAIPQKEASLEVRAQMLAWHANSGTTAAPGHSSASPAPLVVADESSTSEAEKIKELNDRIEALQQGLDELKRQTASQSAPSAASEQVAAAPSGAEAPVSATAPVTATAPVVTTDAPVTATAPVTASASAAAPSVSPSPWANPAATVSTAPTTVAATNTDAPKAVGDAGTDAPPARKSHDGLLAGAGVLLAAAFGFALRRYRRRAAEDADDAYDARPADRYDDFKPYVRPPELDSQDPVETQTVYRISPRPQTLPDHDAGIETILEGDTARCRAITPDEPAKASSGETTVTIALTTVPTYDPTLELPRRKDFDSDAAKNDLENSETHVNMPSGLNEQVTFKERRTNVVDVLRSAIEREPDRMDLRIKLMELYHSTAEVNRQGFIDAARKLAEQPNYQATPEWEKIVAMGRQIAPEDPLFALDPTVQQEKLADCA